MKKEFVKKMKNKKVSGLEIEGSVLLFLIFLLNYSNKSESKLT